MSRSRLKQLGKNERHGFVKLGRDGLADLNDSEQGPRKGFVFNHRHGRKASYLNNIQSRIPGALGHNYRNGVESFSVSHGDREMGRIGYHHGGGSGLMHAPGALE